MRLDIFLVQQGLAVSRARAGDLIRAGFVEVSGLLIRKPAYDIDAENPPEITLLKEDHPYVSRAALKLKPFLALLAENVFTVAGKVTVDLGASTGGFTQLLLEEGAKTVYAIDIGSGQLNEKIATDARVQVFEQTDARDVTAEMFPVSPTLLVADLSFISLTHIIAGLASRLPEVKDAIFLVKPQFELSPKDIGKGGIVRSSELREKALQNVIACLEEEGWRIMEKCEAAIAGADGNREWLVYAARS